MKLPVFAAIAWLVIVTILLSMPGNEFPKLNWLNKIWFDKWVHIGLFLVLVIFWCWAFAGVNKQGQLKKIFVKIMLLSFLYGILMEIIQFGFIPYRSFDIFDIVADGLGCLAGYYFALKKIIPRSSGG